MLMFTYNIMKEILIIFMIFWFFYKRVDDEFEETGFGFY